MDFGLVGLDGLFGSNISKTSTAITTTNTTTTTSPTSASGFSSFASLDVVPKQKNPRSGFLQQERSGSIDNDFRSSKLLKTESLLFQKESTLNPSFKSISFLKDGDNDGKKQPQMLSFSYPKSEALSLDRSYQNASLFPSFHLTPTAYNSRSTGYGYTMSNIGSMQLGVLTQSQLMELEHQALIYKYITSNVPIPSNLLIPIKKAVESARLSCFPGSLLRTNPLGWENFHLGYSGNTDPEPGRCRRTDGKKWRCSRDAVPDQKYCERHVNRGRHRSRKPVEGQSGQSAAASTITGKGLLSTSPNTAASVVVGSQGSGDLNSLSSLQQQQLKNLQLACSPDISAATSLSRTVLDKENRESATLFFNLSVKHTSSTSDGGYVSMKDYMPSTSSPSNERMTASPFRLSPESNPTDMGLSIGRLLNEPNPRRSSWISIPCETSLGGPLGEVLKNTSKNSYGESKNPSSLNLMMKVRGVNPPFDSSPTGILQKTIADSILSGSVESLKANNNYQ